MEIPADIVKLNDYFMNMQLFNKLHVLMLKTACSKTLLFTYLN